METTASNSREQPPAPGLASWTACGVEAEAAAWILPAGVRESRDGEEASLRGRVPPLADAQGGRRTVYKKCRDCGKFSDIPDHQIHAM